MLAVLGDLIRNLVVIIFLNAILEMLLPQGQFQRYIRLVTGLIVILMMVNAAGTILGRIPPDGALVPVAAPITDAAVREQGARLWRLNRERALDQYRAALRELIREAVEETGVWRLSGIRLTLEEDPGKKTFGTLYRVEVEVRAAVEDKQRGSIDPVRIDPVTPGAGEPANKSAGGGKAERVPELEQSLAGRLQIPSAIIIVMHLN